MTPHSQNMIPMVKHGDENLTPTTEDRTEIPDVVTKCITKQDGSSCIKALLAWIHFVWCEVVVCCPSLYTVYAIQHWVLGRKHGVDLLELLFLKTDDVTDESGASGLKNLKQ